MKYNIPPKLTGFFLLKKVAIVPGGLLTCKTSQTK